MKEEFRLLNDKIDKLTYELAQIKSLLSSNNFSSPIKTYTIKEAANYLQLSVSRVYELVYSKKLHPLNHKKNCRLRFTTDQLNQYLYET